MQIKEIQKLSKLYVSNIDNMNTKKKYKTALNNLNSYINKKNTLQDIDEHIEEVTSDNIRIFLDEYKMYLRGNHEAIKLGKELSNNTINQYLILVRNFLDEYCNIHLKQLKLLKVVKQDPKYLSQSQIETAISYIDEERKKKKNTKSRNKTLDIDKMLILLLYNTGLRISECLSIEIKDILQLVQDKYMNYQLKIIGKGSKTRTIIITPEIYKKLKKYIGNTCKSNQKYLFESKKKTTSRTPLSVYTVERNFKNLAIELDEKLEIKSKNKESYQNLLKPHSLRHSYTMSKLDANVPINKIQKLLGHSNITTTQIYAESTTDDISRAIFEINN